MQSMETLTRVGAPTMRLLDSFVEAPDPYETDAAPRDQGSRGRSTELSGGLRCHSPAQPERHLKYFARARSGRFEERITSRLSAGRITDG
jgi:hypothetical protein